MSYVATIRKAIGAAIAAALSWATIVVESPSGDITSMEWLALGTLAAGVAAVFGLTNATANADK